MMRRMLAVLAAMVISLPGILFPSFLVKDVYAASSPIVLRICNWEEYIDLGGWDKYEAIELESGTVFGQNSMIKDFEEWYYKTYGQKVRVEYSCFGTNEELYNMLTLGDEYDLVCPSEYMIMKLMAEDWLVPFSDEFFDESIPNNYYIKGVSPFIKDTFDSNYLDGEAWSKYAAGYTWGITGIMYDPEVVTRQEASTWKIINNDKFKRQITIKDNVRDSMFAAIGALKSDKLMSDSFKNSPDYHDNLVKEMNDISDGTLDEVQDFLQKVKNNVYSFETDSGKADMITGKIVAGYQWSGDAVYTMDQADEDDLYLEFAVPEESTNLYFDGWVMLQNGIRNDSGKQHAAEAFINFLSKPENAIRNMYYIGYTSVISGGDSNLIYEYVKWNYEADEDEENAVDYPLGFFFSGDGEDERYIIKTDESQLHRQLAAQYPSEEVLERSVVMRYMDSDDNAAINRMWINVRCYNINNIPIWIWFIAGAVFAVGLIYLIKRKLS